MQQIAAIRPGFGATDVSLALASKPATFYKHTLLENRPIAVRPHPNELTTSILLTDLISMESESRVSFKLKNGKNLTAVRRNLNSCANSQWPAPHNAAAQERRL
jgi:hypothetical protein